jgi:predicted MFS family arabinose efflux permease
VDPRPYLRLLARNRDFGRVYAAQLVSFAGDWFATVALLGLCLQVTGSSAVASLVLVLQTGPFFLVSPFAGMLADRLDRRRLLIVADVARIPVCLSFMLARDASTLWIALAGSALLSVGAAFFEPTSSASLPNLVDREDLPIANALSGAAWGTMVAIGASVGGLVTAVLGRDAAFLMDALSFAVSASLIWGVRRSFREVRGEDAAREVAPVGLGGLRVAIGETLELARRSHVVAALLVTKTTFGAGMGVLVLLAVFGREVFKGGDVGIGILFAARGLGALIGPFAARTFAADDDRRMLKAIAIALVVFIGGYGLLPLAPSIALGALCVFAAHLGGGAQWMLSSYGLQRSVPDRVRGRVLSFDYAAVTLATTVSTLVAGGLAVTVGPVVTLYVMMAMVALSGGAWLLWTRPLRRAPPVHPGAVAQAAAPPRTLDP